MAAAAPRTALSLAVDGVVIALCWNITYLFRLGFERWISARPSYDGWVLPGVVARTWRLCAAARAAEHVALRRLRRGQAADAGLRWAPASPRRWSSWAGPEQGAARRAGAAPGGHADGRVPGAHRLPHALRAHARAHHRRRRRDPAGDRAGRRRPARHAGCWPASTNRAGPCWPCWTTTRPTGARIAGVPVLGPLADARTGLGDATHLIVAMPALAGPAQRRRALDLAADVGGCRC